MRRTLVPAVLCAGLLISLVSVPAAAGAGGAAAQAADEAGRPDQVELNTATSMELQTLPGVGVRTAQLIIEYREEQGGFSRPEELMNIRGIGEKTFLRLRPLVRVEPVDAPSEER